MNNVYKYLRYAMICIIMALLAIIAYRIVYVNCTTQYDGELLQTDFLVHMQESKHILDDGFAGILNHVGYPLWHIGTWTVQYLLNSKWYVAAGINTAILYACMYLVYYISLNKRIDNGWIRVMLAAYLMILQPISKAGVLFQLAQRSQLISAWHNPTNIWARLLAVPIVLLAMRIWTESEKVSWKQYVALGIMLCVVNLGKPSFSQVFIPSICIFCVVACIKERFAPFKTCLRLAVACLPSLILMAIQWGMTFEGNGEGGVEIAWFKVMAASNKLSPVVLLGTIAFPLYYVIAYKKWKNPSEEMKFAWLMYAISFLEFAALAEVGERTYHCNFGWGYMIAIMILHMVCILDFIERKRLQKMDAIAISKGAIAIILLLLHFVSGISWMWYEISEAGLLIKML